MDQHSSGNKSNEGEAADQPRAIEPNAEQQPVLGDEADAQNVALAQLEGAIADAQADGKAISQNIPFLAGGNQPFNNLIGPTQNSAIQNVV